MKSRSIITIVVILAFVTVGFITAVQAQEVQPLTGEYTRKSDRDPFVPFDFSEKTDEAKQEETITHATTDTGKAEPAAEKKQDADKTAEQKEEQKKPRFVEVDSGLKLTGILATPAGYSAIVSGQGKSYVVRRGSRLGDWTVTQVTARSITITATGSFDTIELESKPEPE